MRTLKRRQKTLRLLTAALLVAGAVSCAWIRQVPDPEDPASPEYQESLQLQYFEKTLVKDSAEQYKKLAVQGELVLAGDSDLYAQRSAAAQGAECLRQPVQLRFAWYTDVQLRQRDVKLFSRRTSESLDHVIPSFESDPVHEEFAWATYLSHLLALNRYQESLTQRGEPPLRFFIHTGDAIDAGTIEELYRFVFLTNQLNIPWYNAIGNHDVSIFGNYRRNKSYTLDAGVAFYPVGQLRNFLRMHGNERRISGFGPHLLPVPAAPGGAAHNPTVQGGYAVEGGPVQVRSMPGSSCHGFDLQVPGSKRTESGCQALPGYYAFDLEQDGASRLDVRLRVIVLNSEEDSRFGAGSTVGERQITWLRDMLHGARDRTTLLFSHHRLSGLPKAVLSVLRSAQNGPLIAFTGHTHQSHVERFTSESGRDLYELNSSALMTFPQVGRIIELRGQGARGCLVSRAVWPRLVAADLHDLRPHALTKEHKRELELCDALRLRIRKDLAGAVRCSRLGALRDSQRTDTPEWGRPQDFAAAWPEMNVVIPLELVPSDPASAAQK